MNKLPELILTYEEHQSGGEATDPDDTWTDYTPEYIDWSPLRIFIDEPDKPARKKTKEWRVESLRYNDNVKVGDTICLVIVRYTTGSTFGTTYGAWHIEDVFKIKEEAMHVAALIEKDNLNYKITKPSRSKERIYVSPYGSKCWQGYFESLESVNIQCFIVE